MWLYDGLPDGLGISVRDATPNEGGYVVVLELQSREIRMLATRFPARYISIWKSRTQRYGGEELKRVMVTQTHPRYERVKRMLIQSLAEKSKDRKTQTRIEIVQEKVKEIFNMKVPDVGLGNSLDPSSAWSDVDRRGMAWLEN